MGLAANAESMTTYLGMVIGIAALALSVFLFLRLGGPLVARLGPGAVAGITRIFGFLIFAVAVQLVWDGAADFGKLDCKETTWGQPPRLSSRAKLGSGGKNSNGRNAQQPTPKNCSASLSRTAGGGYPHMFPTTSG